MSEGNIPFKIPSKSSKVQRVKHREAFLSKGKEKDHLEIIDHPNEALKNKDLL
jgi:hypothetical protein